MSYPSQILIGLVEAVNHFEVNDPALDKLVYIDEAKGRLNV